MPPVGFPIRETNNSFTFFGTFSKKQILCYNLFGEKRAKDMIEKIIATIITFLVSAALGYCLSVIKTFKDNKSKEKENEKKNENVQNEALKTMLQNSLTNTYFVYENLGKIPDYVYKNWLNLLKAYEGLDGDDYIHVLADRMKKWKIEKTDILK